MELMRDMDSMPAATLRCLHEGRNALDCRQHSKMALVGLDEVTCRQTVAKPLVSRLQNFLDASSLTSFHDHDHLQTGGHARTKHCSAIFGTAPRHA